MTTLKCKKCQYEFAPRTKGGSTLPKRCPYCGAEGSVSEKRHIVEEL